jgi:hypothetical protein
MKAQWLIALILVAVVAMPFVVVRKAYIHPNRSEIYFRCLPLKAVCIQVGAIGHHENKGYMIDYAFTDGVTHHVSITRLEGIRKR